jgi:hypothetical protein
MSAIEYEGITSVSCSIVGVRFAADSPLEGDGFGPSVPRERVCAFRARFTPCNRSSARYRSKWYIDDGDGPLLFGLGIHGQYLLVDAERQLSLPGVVPGAAARRCAHSRDTAGCIGGTARHGWLALAPNGREPRLLMPRQSRRAVIMAHLHEAGRGDVIAPSVKIEKAGIAVIAQALLVIPSRI